MARLAAAISRRGEVIPRARSWTMASDSTPAASPDAVDRPDDRGAELAPEGLDVGVDGAGPEPVAVAPDVGQELLPGEDHPRLVAEEGQDVELGGGEVDGLAVEGGPPGGRLEGNPAQPERAARRVG